MNKELTQEQLEKFWGWWGFKYRAGSGYGKTDFERYGATYLNGNHYANRYSFPALDLNSLFQYVVPKLQDKGFAIELMGFEHKGFVSQITDVIHPDGAGFCHTIADEKNDDPTLALFWAIYQVMEEQP